MTTTATAHESFIRQAIALAERARSEGNHPFGALLAIDGESVLTAMNSVGRDRDPTAHAESNLVAAAIHQLSREQMSRAVLYTSCEPCAMCAGSMYWAGIRTVVYGLSSAELATLAGPDFLVPCRELFQRAREPVTVVGPLLTDEALAVHSGFWPPPASMAALAPSNAVARIVDSRFVLAMRDLERSTAYYVDVLGFTRDPIDADGWSFLTRNKVRLMLGECPDEQPAGELANHSYFASWNVDDVDELFREITARGALVSSRPQDQPWGLREFGLQTPDGHRITCGQLIRR